MYDEKIDCRLIPSSNVDDRIANWNRINSKICINYLQHKFYLVEPTMKSLAKGKTSDSIFKLISVLITTQQNDYASVNATNTNTITDIADQLEGNATLDQSHFTARNEFTARHENHNTSIEMNDLLDNDLEDGD
jgi:hypothetical protein